MSLPGHEMHDRNPNGFRQPGNHKKPMRCTDSTCPSRSNCHRPDFEGEDHDFKHNRGQSAICAYLVKKEGGNA